MGAHSHLILQLWVCLVASNGAVARQATTDQHVFHDTARVQGGTGSNSQTALVPDGYRQEIAPWPRDGTPLLVNFSIKVNGIVKADDRQTAVLIDSFFRVTWEDWRLNYPEEGWGEGDPRSRPSEEGKARKMIVNPVILDKVWLPDPYIFNVRSVRTIRILKDMQGVYVYPNNTIFISTVLKIELDCSAMFSKFPFDVQECRLDIQSFMYEAPQIQMQWLPGGLAVDPHVTNQLTNYDFEFTTVHGNTTCLCYMCIPPDAPCVRARLVLRRKALGHLLATFFPSGLFVAVSWASLFWPAEVIPGRTVLLITALLTLVSMHTAVRQSSPETSYVKAVDVWMFMCILLSIMTLFEYGIVLIIKRRRVGMMVQDSTCISRNNSMMGRDPQACRPQYDEKLESVARVFIPIVFLLFNVVYWPYYLKD